MSVAFFQPESLAEAQRLLGRYGDDAKLIAGGTAVVLMLQNRLIAPVALVSLSYLPGLGDLRMDDDGLHLGASAHLAAVAGHPDVRCHYPALAEACRVVGNVRIRNQGTLGGNLAEADYASDPPAALLALDASVTLSSERGERELSLADFLVGLYTTALEPDEILTGVFVPALPGETRMQYRRYMSRTAEDRPCVGLAAVATFDDGLCRELRLAVGAACEVPQRLPEVELLAAGRPLDDEVVAEIAAGYAAGIAAIGDLRGSAWYRTEMIRVHVRRILEEIRDRRR
jgi:carbon-monoxide dehydrogenase medium subunit